MSRKPKLSVTEQADVIQRYESGKCCQASIASHYGVSQPTISRIVSGKTAKKGAKGDV